MEHIFPFLFLAFVSWFLFALFTKRGREITLYGGKVMETIDIEIDQSKGMVSSKIRVHKIQKKKEVEPSVTIVTTNKAPLAFSINPMNLSRTEALQLITMLQRAVK